MRSKVITGHATAAGIVDEGPEVVVIGPVPGSWTAANPDAIVGMVGLTGIPFTDVFNA